MVLPAGALKKCLVQKANQRRDAPENANQAAVKLRARGEGRGEFGARQKLSMFEVLGRLMIFGKAARHTLQTVAFQSADSFPERGGRDDRAKAPVIGRDMLANHLKLRRLRRPQP